MLFGRNLTHTTKRRSKEGANIYGLRQRRTGRHDLAFNKLFTHTKYRHQMRTH